MTIRYVFNPFTGTLDLIDVTDTSNLAELVPTLLAAGATFTVPANSQALFTRPIVESEGSKIVLGDNAVVVGVT